MKPIDIKKLQPPGVLERALELRQEDMRRYADPATGMLREDLAEEIDCYICDEDDTSLVFSKEGFRFVRCNLCGLVYVNPRIREEKTTEFYNIGRFTFTFTNLYIPSAQYRKDRFYTERLDFIESYKPGKGKLLDVGSAAGHFVESALERGWDAYGVEVGRVGAEHATEELGLENIYHGTLQEANFPSEVFDVVTLWDVLEHLTRPLEVLREAHRVLKPDGMVFVYVPNFESAEVMLCGQDCDNIVADAHVIYFTPATLRRLLEKASFEVVHTETQGIDVDHVIFNIKNVFDKKYDVDFLEDKKNILQDIFNRAGLGNNLRMYARKA